MTNCETVKGKDIGLAYFYMFIAVFGVKLNSFIDFTVLLYLITILLCFNKTVINTNNKKFITLLVLIMAYDIFISLANYRFDIVFTAKFLRIILAVLSTSCFIKYITPLSRNQLIHIIINIILLHAVIIIIESTLWIDLQNILKFLSGYERDPLKYRGTGFTNGYDFAGVMCICGFLLTVFSNEKRHRIIKEIVFICACFLSSRITMLVVELIFIIIILNHKRFRIKKDLLLCFGCLLFTAIPVLGIFLYSTYQTENIIIKLLSQIELFDRIFKNLADSYAITNILNTAEQHFSFEELSKFQLIFGSAQMPNQDPGYTQYIFEVGLVGLILSLLFYLIMLNSCFKRKNKSNLDRLMLLIILIILSLSFKNSYILARHITDLLIILFYINSSSVNCNQRQVFRRTILKQVMVNGRS